MTAQLRVHESIHEIPQPAWDALHTDEDSPFVEWAWLAALEDARCVGRARGWTPRILGRYRDGQLVAAAPAYIKDNSEGEFVYDWAWADVASRLRVAYYPKLVFAVPFTPATGTRLLRAPGEGLDETAELFGQGARALADKLDLSGVHVLFPRESEAAALARCGYVRRYGVQFHWHNEGYRTFDDFLARFQSKRRNALRRERAQLVRDGMRVVTHRGDAITRDLIDPMLTFYLATVDKFVWGRRYLNRAFFERVVECFRHRLEWVVAYDGAGAPVAGAFNAARGKKLYGRYWGATREYPFLHFNVCFYKGIEDCITEGRAVFEPGAGGEHKLVRGFDPTVTHSAHWIADARLARVLGDFLSREGPAVHAAVERELAESPLRRKGHAAATAERPED
jgi:predicted N-acyltransferase